MSDARWDWLPGFAPSTGSPEAADMPPAAAAAEPRQPLAPHPDTVLAALQLASESNMSLLLCLGWAPTALPLLVRDQWLRRKQVVWAVHPGHVADAQDTLAQLWDGEAAIWLVTYEDVDDLTRIVRALPSPHMAVASFEEDPRFLRHVQHQRIHRFCVSSFTIERICEDLTHVLARAGRLDRSIPISAWKGRLAGTSALCIAAGPSLDQAMPFVRRHMDSCVVIVCDVVWKRLQEEGIRVDFVVTVDTLNDNFSDRIVATRDPRTVLVLPPSAHRCLDERFPNHSYFFSAGIDHHIVANEGFSTGTNVGRSTVGFAHHLGCSEIVLVGHDLAFDTPGYYSSMVHDRQPLADSEQKLHGGAKFTLPGNAGIEVPSMIAFRIGVDDLASIVHRDPGLGWYNYNINQRCGARVPGFLAVPDGWSPKPLQRPLPLPSERLPADAVAKALDMPRRLEDELNRLEAAWTAGLDKGATPIEIAHEVSLDRTLDAGRDFAEPYLNGFYAFLFSLASMPQAVSTGGHALETARCLVAAIRHSRETVRRIAATHAYTQPPLEGPGTPWKPLITELSQRVPGVPADSHLHVVIPLMAREYVSLLRNVAGAELPAPLSLVDGVMAGLAMGSWVPRSFVEQVVCLCAMATSAQDETVISARKAGLIDLAPAWPLPEGPAHLRATIAVLALGGGIVPADAAAEACQAAAAWHPCHSALVSALSKRPDFHVRLGELLAGKRLRPDDQLASLIVAKHPDPLVAADLLEPFGPYGDATSLAIASRLHSIAAYPLAIEEARRIHLLSPFAEDALFLICACSESLGLQDEVQRTIAAIPNHRLACMVLYRYVKNGYGPLTALQNLVDIGAFPIPQPVVNEVLQWAIAGCKPGERAAAIPVLDQAIAGSLDAEMHANERELMRGCQIVLGELRVAASRQR